MCKACEHEVAGQLYRLVHILRGRRNHFDDHDRSRRDERVARDRRAAIDDDVGLIGGLGVDDNGDTLYQYVALDALRLDSDYPEPKPGDLLTIEGHADPDLNGSAEFISRKVDEYAVRPLFGPKAGRATSVRAFYVREG